MLYETLCVLCKIIKVNFVNVSSFPEKFCIFGLDVVFIPS